jgi:hypothetical protein
MFGVTFAVLAAFGIIIVAIKAVRRSTAVSRSLAGRRTFVTVLVVALSLTIGLLLLFANPVNWEVAVPF